MTRLSVNINKIALIRNSRGANMPNLAVVAKDCEAFGAQGITVHPRPDQRHVRFDDLQPLKDVVTTEFNIEGYPSKNFIEVVCDVKPHQVTLVPDPPQALTSNTGWDTIQHQQMLKDIVAEFKLQGIRVSLFLNPDPLLVEPAQSTGADRIELYSGDYAKYYYQDREKAIAPFVETAKVASKLGLGVNAGHDLNLDNLNYFFNEMPGLLEVSIGHAIVCDALYYGLHNVINMYKRQLTKF